MPTTNPKTTPQGRDPWRLVALAFEGLGPFEFGIVVEIFGIPRPELGRWYDFRVATTESGPIQGLGGALFQASGGLDVLDRAGTIVIPGWPRVDEAPPEPLLRKLRRAHREGARIVSLCSGAFVLAAADLLNGRRATTHWRYAERLAERFPAVEVDPDVLYVDCGDVLTSAGSAAGIDLCLHLVRRDHGAEVANSVARRLVVQPHRGGGQKQFITAPVPPSPAHDLAELLDTVRERLAEDHSVASMAHLAQLSPRTFARRFAERTGTTPHRWLIAERVRRARDLLETTDLPLDRIAESCGFSDPQLLRLHFRRLVGHPPSVYRRHFRPSSTE